MLETLTSSGQIHHTIPSNFLTLHHSIKEPAIKLMKKLDEVLKLD